MAEILTPDSFEGDSYLEKLQKLKSLQKKAQIAHDRRLALARTDYRHFAEYVMKDESSGSNIKLAPLHIKWIEHIYYAWSHGLHAFILAPYASGKTSCIAVGMPLFLLGNNPSLRIIIVSSNDSIAGERLVLIRQYIENSEEYHELFPHIKADTDVGWCIPLGELVDSCLGKKVPIEDLRLGDLVYGFDGNKVRPALVKDVSRIFFKESCTVTLRSGREFKSSLDHKFLSPGGWKPLREFMESEPIALARGYARRGYYNVSDKEAALLGYLIGDGYVACKSGGGQFTNSNWNIASDFSNCVYHMGWRVRIDPNTKGSTHHLRILDCFTPKTHKDKKKGRQISKPRQWLIDIGILGDKSATKRIPSVVMFGGPGAARSFLRAYFACDGWIELINHDSARIGFGSISKGLLQDCQDMLRRYFGVKSVLNRVGIAWRLSSAGWDAVDLCNILFSDDEQIEKHRKCKEWATRFLSLCKDKSKRFSDKWAIQNCKNKYRFRGPEDPDCIEWDEITSLSESIIMPCIDIEVDVPVSNFILGNGVLAHNTKSQLFLKRSTMSKDPSLSATGATSSGIGKRADIIILDDINDAKNTIHQPKMRDVIWGNFTGVYLSRLEPGGKVLGVATRWHEQDLVGKILENEEMRASYAFLIQRVAEDFESLECETIIPAHPKASPVKHRSDMENLFKLYENGVI